MLVANEQLANPSPALPTRAKNFFVRNCSRERTTDLSCLSTLCAHRIQIYRLEFRARMTSETSFVGDEIGEKHFDAVKESFPAGISRPIVIARRFVPVKAEWRGKDAISEITNRGGKWSIYDDGITSVA